MTDVSLNQTSYQSGSNVLLKPNSVSFESNSLTAIVGPNGAGKSTLLQCASGLLAPSDGSVTINGLDAASLASRDRARTISYLPQTRTIAWPQPVEEIVALGRFHYGCSPHILHGDDRKAVDNAIDQCSLHDLKHRRCDQLSGGEIARVHIARALASQSPMIFADEPVAALDPKHQLSIMQTFRTYCDEGGGAVVIMHDLNLAAQFCDRLIWMKDGEIVCDGPPAQTLTPARIQNVFEVRASVVASGAPGTVSVTYIDNS